MITLFKACSRTASRATGVINTMAMLHAVPINQFSTEKIFTKQNNLHQQTADWRNYKNFEDIARDYKLKLIKNKGTPDKIGFTNPSSANQYFSLIQNVQQNLKSFKPDSPTQTEVLSHIFSDLAQNIGFLLIHSEDSSVGSQLPVQLAQLIKESWKFCKGRNMPSIKEYIALVALNPQFMSSLLKYSLFEEAKEILHEFWEKESETKLRNTLKGLTFVDSIALLQLESSKITPILHELIVERCEKFTNFMNYIHTLKSCPEASNEILSRAASIFKIHLGSQKLGLANIESVYTAANVLQKHQSVYAEELSMYLNSVIREDSPKPITKSNLETILALLSESNRRSEEKETVLENINIVLERYLYTAGNEISSIALLTILNLIVDTSQNQATCEKILKQLEPIPATRVILEEINELDFENVCQIAKLFNKKLYRLKGAFSNLSKRELGMIQKAQFERKVIMAWIMEPFIPSEIKEEIFSHLNAKSISNTKNPTLFSAYFSLASRLPNVSLFNQPNHILKRMLEISSRELSETFHEVFIQEICTYLTKQVASTETDRNGVNNQTTKLKELLDRTCHNRKKDWEDWLRKNYSEIPLSLLTSLFYQLLAIGGLSYEFSCQLQDHLCKIIPKMSHYEFYPLQKALIYDSIQGYFADEIVHKLRNELANPYFLNNAIDFLSYELRKNKQKFEHYNEFYSEISNALKQEAPMVCVFKLSRCLLFLSKWTEDVQMFLDVFKRKIEDFSELEALDNSKLLTVYLAMRTFLPDSGSVAQHFETKIIPRLSELQKPDIWSCFFGLVLNLPNLDTQNPLFRKLLTILTEESFYSIEGNGKNRSNNPNVKKIDIGLYSSILFHLSLLDDSECHAFIKKQVPTIQTLLSENALYPSKTSDKKSTKIWEFITDLALNQQMEALYLLKYAGIEECGPEVEKALLQIKESYNRVPIYKSEFNSFFEVGLYHSLTTQLFAGEEVVKEYWIPPFYADFYVPKHQLVLECNGRQHYYFGTEKLKLPGEKRAFLLEKMGYKVLNISVDEWNRIKVDERVDYLKERLKLLGIHISN